MFVPKEQRASALGSFKEQKDKAYFLQIQRLFEPMPQPKGGDWLEHHKEVHQAFANYRLPYYNKITPQRKTIYLQQFGEFNHEFLKKLVQFCGIFYPGLAVGCLPVLDFATELGDIRCRKHTYGKQYLAQDILKYMESHVPKDAYCVMGITLEDIYPGENWNFVYGWAKYKARVGIFSFLRWDDAFAEKQTKEIDWQLILYPSLRTMVHEIGHMFGITHCVYYRCLMNGFNHIEENYRNPLQFCPICYRKIWTNIEFDRKRRYEKLIKGCKELQVKELTKDAAFYQSLLDISVQQEEKVDSSKRPAIGRRPIETNNKANRGKSLQVGIRRR